VALVWSATSQATGTNIFASVSADAGLTFSPPVRVNTIERQANINGEQPPRVAFERAADGRRTIVVLWTAKGREGTALLLARSRDDGRTFDPAAPLKGVDAPGNRGWESLASVAGGPTYALWLDHRDTVQAGGGTEHHHQPGSGTSTAGDGVQRAQRSQLFVASLDGTVEPKGIARGVCYCCKTALTTDADGNVYAAWRHVYAGNMRDIAFTLSRDGGRTFAEPVRVSADDWQLDGCPENGPALGIGRDGRIHIVWPTLVPAAGGETLALFHASSTDGRAFTPRRALPVDGPAYHPQMAIGENGRLIVAWDESTSGQRRVRIARGRSDAAAEFTAAQLDGDTSGSYPALASTGTHAVLAWAEDAQRSARIAIRRIPF
jgi:hypothetical protein